MEKLEIFKAGNAVLEIYRDAPGESGREAIKLLVEIVAEAADRLSQGNAGSENGGREPEVEFFLFRENKQRDQAGHDAAMDRQAAFPDLDDLHRVIKVIGQFQKNMVESGAGDSEKYRPKHRIKQIILILLIFFPQFNNDNRRREHAKHDKEAVPING